MFIPLRFLCFTPFFYFHSLYPFCLSACLSRFHSRAIYLHPCLFTFLLTFTGSLPSRPLILVLLLVDVSLLPPAPRSFPCHRPLLSLIPSATTHSSPSRPISPPPLSPVARTAQPPVFACEINAFLFRPELNASLHKETPIYSFILRVKKKTGTGGLGVRLASPCERRTTFPLTSFASFFRGPSPHIFSPFLSLSLSLSLSFSPFARRNARRRREEAGKLVGQMLAVFAIAPAVNRPRSTDNFVNDVTPSSLSFRSLATLFFP